MEKQLDNIAIVEIKQEKVNRYSPIWMALHKLKHRPFGFSKYALGMVMLHAVSKSNAFKQKVNKVNQLSSCNGSYRYN